MMGSLGLLVIGYIGRSSSRSVIRLVGHSIGRLYVRFVDRFIDCWSVGSCFHFWVGRVVPSVDWSAGLVGERRLRLIDVIKKKRLNV